MRRTPNALLLAIAGLGVALAVRERARQRRKISFPGKTVLITGGSRGLGLELARLFADKGCRLALCARNIDELERAREELTHRGAEVFLLPFDVTDGSEVAHIVNAVEDRFGPIDILVNNAGVIQVGPMDEMTPEDYRQTMDVHFWAPLAMIQAVLPGMRRQQRGRIVNIASIGGKISVPHLLPYSASKFALVGLSEGLRAELSKEHIYVTTVCPGLMRTGSHIHARFKGQNQKEYTLFTIGNASSLASIDSREAAQEIVQACKFGDAEVTFPFTSKAAAAFHGLFPGLTADLLGLVNKALPGPGGIGKSSKEGRESQTKLAPSWLTAPSDEASSRNNEVAT